MLTMLPFSLISSKQTVSCNQCLCCSTGLKLSWPKTKLQNVGACDPSSTMLIDHSSYAVLPTIDHLQLGWLTSGVDPGGWAVLTFLKICSVLPKYVGRVRVCFDPLNVTFFHPKLLLYNCKFRNINIKLDTITSLILFMQTMLLSLCLISSKQTMSSNQCLCWYTEIKLSWPLTKLQNMRAGDPLSTILIGGVAVEGVEEFIYLGSKQSSTGNCRLDVLRRIGLACSAMNSLESVWNCSSLSISTKVHLCQALIRSVLL